MLRGGTCWQTSSDVLILPRPQAVTKPACKQFLPSQICAKPGTPFICAHSWWPFPTVVPCWSPNLGANFLNKCLEGTLKGQVSVVTALPPQVVSHFDDGRTDTLLLLIFCTTQPGTEKIAKVLPRGHVTVQIHIADSNTPIPWGQLRYKCDLVYMTPQRVGTDATAVTVWHHYELLSPRTDCGILPSSMEVKNKLERRKGSLPPPLTSPEGSQLLCPKD